MRKGCSNGKDELFTTALMWGQAYGITLCPTENAAVFVIT